MHDSDSFISEVSEEVRRDRLYATLRRYAWLIAAAVVLIVGGAAYNAWRTSRDAVAAEAAGDALTAALAIEDPVERAEALAGFTAAEPGTAPVAALAQAGSLAEAGDDAAAAGVLAGIAEARETTDVYRAVAALERVMVLGAEMDASERAATLDNLVTPGAPFRALALEQRALMHADAGDDDAAIADLQAVLDEPSSTDALRARARQLIVALGGAVPNGGLAAAGGDAPPASPADG